jgi:hypothetical protein
MPRVHALWFVALVRCCACWGVVSVGYFISSCRGLRLYDCVAVLWMDLLCLKEQQYVAGACASPLWLYLRMFEYASALYMTGHYPLLFSPRSVQVSCTAHLSSLLFYRVLALTSSISCTSVVRHTKSAETLLTSVYT